MTTPPPSNSRLPALDFLRFAAALAVTLYHYVSSFPQAGEAAHTLIEPFSAVTRYGYLGVDLFFMISGFVILWSSQNRTALSFAVSRAGRLYPSFWVAMLLSASFLALMPHEAARIGSPTVDAKILLGNATMIPNVLGIPMVDGVYWTLEMEIRFYAIVFALLLFRQMHRLEVWLAVWLVASIGCTAMDLPWLLNFLTIQPYGALFITGAYFYLIYANGQSIGRLAGLTVAAGLSCYLSLAQRTGFITPDAISAVVVPAVMIAFFLLFAMMALRKHPVGLSPIATLLGSLTYPLYLIHGTIGRLVFEALPQRLGLEARIGAITLIALVLAYILSITAETYGRRAFEKAISAGLQALGYQPARKVA